MIEVVKPKMTSQVGGSSIFSSGIAFNQYSPKRQKFGLLANFESVKDNLRNILFFRKGDYLDNSDFGVGLQDFLFEPADEILRIALSQETRRQISKYEPRVVIRNLTVTTPDWADDAVVIDMDLLVNNVSLTGQASANGFFNLT